MQLAETVGLTEAEYERIVQLLGREPNSLELGLYGVLWSEHCSYKSSKDLLSRLPHNGPTVVQGPGENAGVVRLNEDWEVAFKIESHNHPSFVEPVQGAATGVGGILRDIIAMGARPIALADMLRFGRDAWSQHVAAGVVKGIGQYGNAIGVPTVTGEVGWGEPYQFNPLVNVLAVGLRRSTKRASTATARPGQRLVLIGQRTGRDGIHGASLLASRDFSEDATTLRPTVQVGDPFLGKLLLETTLRAVQLDLVGALQDLGAAGLSSAVVELCHASGVGAVVNLDQVLLREEGLTPYDIMLSETQERMLVAVDERQLGELLKLCEQFEVLAQVIGETNDTERLTVFFRSHKVADLGIDGLAGSVPRRVVDPLWWDALPEVTRVDDSDGPVPELSGAVMQKVVGHPDVRDRSPIYRQYDSMIQTRTVWGPDHDVAILHLKEVERDLVIAVSGAGLRSFRDPYAGGLGAVCQAAAHLAARGAQPLGLTDGINAGNPDRAEGFAELSALIRGISDGAQALGVPVTGGNVSLHNETAGQPIWPTAMIGMVGTIKSLGLPLTDGMTAPGLVVFLVNPGPLNWGGSVGQSCYGSIGPYPRIDLALGPRMVSTVTDMVRACSMEGFRAVGRGGLARTLLDWWSRASRQLGIYLTLGLSDPKDMTLRLFNEYPLQWLGLATPQHWAECQRYAMAHNVPVVRLGEVTDNPVWEIEGRCQWGREELLGAWRTPYGEGL